MIFKFFFKVSETPGAQLEMLSNNSGKFHDSMSILFKLCATHVEDCSFFKSSSITLKRLNKSLCKYPGAQLHR
jgi:hypothetical protein